MFAVWLFGLVCGLIVAYAYSAFKENPEAVDAPSTARDGGHGEEK